MNLAIVGATGLVGTELCRILDRETYRISVIGRSRDKLKKSFPDAAAYLTWADFEASDARDYDAIVNLAGASVADKRWTAEYKKIMFDSRIDATRMCTAKCRDNPHIHLINASAVSAYGFYTEPFVRFTEQNRNLRVGTAFLQDLIDKWEETAREAEAYGSPVTLLRTGVVFDPAEAALPALIKPFRMSVGGRIGTGRQIISWISTEDVARIIAFLLGRPDITGAVNCTSPGAVSNREFAKALGRAMGKPSFIPTPGFVIRMAMGQMGDELIVKGQHVYPEKLVEAGFRFEHPTLESYFSEIFPD